jgi:hypothetical protein
MHIWFFNYLFNGIGEIIKISIVGFWWIFQWIILIPIPGLIAMVVFLHTQGAFDKIRIDKLCVEWQFFKLLSILLGFGMRIAREERKLPKLILNIAWGALEKGRFIQINHVELNSILILCLRCRLKL